ncbi:MAG: hypothetical protein IJG68_01915 [Bacilli bacterium]|nr:hypothetical protein [Bacilli bacterium]
MIKRTIDIDGYWKVIVYYNVNYNFFDVIVNDLKSIDISNKTINNVYNNMSKGYAKGVTITSIYYKTSVVLFNKHKTYYDYINTIVHEAEHVKQAMLKAYRVNDEGEAPAYTIGFLVMKMLVLKIVMKLKS